VAFAPDGGELASASEDGRAVLWDVTDRTRPVRLGRPLTGHTGWLSSVAFAPDGHTVATASSDKTVILQAVAPPPPRGTRPGGPSERVTDLASAALTKEQLESVLAACQNLEAVPGTGNCRETLDKTVASASSATSSPSGEEFAQGMSCTPEAPGCLDVGVTEDGEVFLRIRDQRLDSPGCGENVALCDKGIIVPEEFGTRMIAPDTEPTSTSPTGTGPEPTPTPSEPVETPTPTPTSETTPAPTPTPSEPVETPTPTPTSETTPESAPSRGEPAETDNPMPPTAPEPSGP
jgi:WD domain, G-beta repeat